MLQAVYPSQSPVKSHDNEVVVNWTNLTGDGRDTVYNPSGDVNDLTTPPPLPSGQTLEEQLQQLQNQQQLQLQSLQDSLGGAQDPPHISHQPHDVATQPPPLGAIPQQHDATGTGYNPSSSSPHHQAPPPADQSSISTPFSPGYESTGHSSDVMDDGNSNQVLMDLQMLLQPPSELSSLATPLEPESPEFRGEKLDLATPLHPSVTDQPIEPNAEVQGPSGPTHFHSQTYASSAPNLSGSLMGSPDIDLSTPLNPTPTPPQTPSSQGGITVTPQDEHQYTPPVSTLTQGESTAQPPQLSPHLNNISTPQIPPSVAEEPFYQATAAASLTPANNSMGGFDNTMTITSISRPIATPVLSPPTSPDQRLEPNQDHQTLGNLEQERDVDSSHSMPLEQLSAEETSATLHSRQIGGQSTSQEVNGTPTPDSSENQNECRESLNLVPSQSGFNSTLGSGSVSSLLDDPTHSTVPLDLTSAALQNLANISLVAPPTSTIDFSHGLDTDLHSLPLFTDTSFRPILGISSTSLHTPSSISPLSLDTGSRFAQAGNSMEHFQSLLASNRTLQLSVDEKSREIEQQGARIADQKSQLENYKQQLFVLQQQLGQVSTQQQKQEQEKATASGQQAVLMQLLQQQQGMFSQQQAQIEKLSKVSDSHRKEQTDIEVKYKQALAVEQEKNSALANKNTQQGYEMQRLQQQVQTLSQQQQMVQVHLYQYQTQIQERDKQLLAFRNQHKEIIQSLEHKYQQKVSQMVQQIQELQADLKKARSQRQGLPPVPLRPVSTKGLTEMQAQQFSQTPRPSQQQFAPQLPSTPISAYPSSQAKQVDVFTPPTSASSTSQSASSRSPHPAPSQVPLQHQAFQSQRLGGPFQQSPSNVTNPQQLPTPLTPHPLPGAVPAQLMSLSSGSVNQSLPLANQPSRSIGSARGSDHGIQQQFHTGPPQQPTMQPTSSQPSHMTSQPSLVTQVASPSRGLGAQPLGQMHPQHGGQVLSQGSNPQLQSQQLMPQVGSSTLQNVAPIGGMQAPPGGQGVPGQGSIQGMNIQMPQGT